MKGNIMTSELNETQKEILNKIENAWQEAPMLRFGQLLYALGVLDTDKDCFNDIDLQILSNIDTNYYRVLA